MDHYSDIITELANTLGAMLQQKCWVLAAAESCTGGMLAQAVTSVAGSSLWFDRAFISYSNQAKIDMLGVQEITLETYGAVSEQVANEMAQGAFQKSDASIAVSITGVAGPTGGTHSKPVGMVCFGFAFDSQITTNIQFFSGNRTEIRQQAVIFVMQQLIAQLK